MSLPTNKYLIISQKLSRHNISQCLDWHFHDFKNNQEIRFFIIFRAHETNMRVWHSEFKRSQLIKLQIVTYFLDLLKISIKDKNLSRGNDAVIQLIWGESDSFDLRIHLRFLQTYFEFFWCFVSTLRYEKTSSDSIDNEIRLKRRIKH